MLRKWKRPYCIILNRLTKMLVFTISFIVISFIISFIIIAGIWLTKAYFPNNENMIPYKSHEGLNSSFFSHRQTLEAHPVFFSKYITLMNSYYEILQFQWTLVETFHVLLLGCTHFRNSKLVCFFYISQCLNNKTESRKNKHNKWDGKIDSHQFPT